MSERHTSEVVTLTATVRVLTVGNRQITQSVAKQLDIVRADKIMPFGRVYLFDRQMAIGSDSGGHLVLADSHRCIGKDHADGACWCGCVSPPGRLYESCWSEAGYGENWVKSLPLIILAGLR